MRAQFRPIVRCWSCRRAQPIWGAAESIQQGLQRLAGVVLDDTGFIQHHAHKPRRVEFVQPVIVGDVDAGANLAGVVGVRDRHATRGSFGYCLLRHSQRRKYQ